ncbi:DUF6194 family protein [Actinokineospora guangxiensis]|uniref:DUF6194 family protein n=1 Tax=Actinokineospora guangxiensis TaxID=1490288 RepID=A0ABW0EV12_9PSEU
MDDSQLIGLLLAELDGVIAMESQGDTFLIYDPHDDVPYNRRFPFATVVTADRYDSASNLDRPGAYRLNLGLTKATYRARFSAEGPVDHAAEDVLMPHPVYAPQHWICVVNPSQATVDAAMPLIREAHDFAARKYRPAGR